MLRRAGFFHFAESHCNPLGELAKAMSEVSPAIDLADSLIVLPEGFNLGRAYDLSNNPKEKPRFHERCVLECLRQIAARCEVVFVVSVIEIDTERNSAYFVDAGTPRLMCHKIIDDQSREYELCTIDCQGENPVTCPEEMWIGALICADALDNRPTHCEGVEAAYQRLHSLQSSLCGKRNLVCVPAHMDTKSNDPPMCGGGLILANSRPGFSSLIKDRNGDRLPMPEGLQNHIHLENICRIMAEEK
jgi:predicted amidohydrolase